jgi:Flp pilus assembly protein TadG
VRRPDDGAAVVEFTLVTMLLVVVFLGILQVGISLHMRNVMVASAAEGAREAANANRDYRDAADIACSLIEKSLSRKVHGTGEGQVECYADLVSRPVRDPETGRTSDVELVEVQVRGSLPVLFSPIGSIPFRAAGHAFLEGQ